MTSLFDVPYIKKLDHKIDLDKLINAISNISVDYLNPKHRGQLMLQMQKGSKNPWYAAITSPLDHEQYTPHVSKSTHHNETNIAKHIDDYNLIIPELKGTYIEEMLESLPFKPVRARLTKTGAETCWSLHRDLAARYHIAIITNPLARFIFSEKERLFHIPADGHVYWVDTREEHTFINGIDKFINGELNPPEVVDRIHLIIG